MGSAFTTIVLPVAVATVMLGLGLGLTRSDFERILRSPRIVLVALLCQVLLLPAVCFGLVLAFSLPPELAVGMMLLAAAPGGTSANLISHLFRGDVALNVGLTAINSVVSLITLPVVVNLSVNYFGTDIGTVAGQFRTALDVAVIVLVPVAVGMVIRWRRPTWGDRMDRPVRAASMTILVLVLLGAIITNWRCSLPSSAG